MVCCTYGGRVTFVKIIFVNIMMGMYRGGGENFDLNLSRELAKNGHDIEIYHLLPLFKKTQLKLPEYCTSLPVKAPWMYQWTQYLHLLPVIGRIRGLRGFPRAIGQLIFELHTFLSLWHRRREDFVVHICGLGLLGMLATKVLGNRVYVRFPGPPSFRIHYWFIKNTYRIIANGHAYETIRQHIPANKLLRLEVGINYNIFTKTYTTEQARNKLHLPNDKTLLLFVGRFVKIKNVTMLLRVLARMTKVNSDVALVLVGDGPEQISLMNQAKQLGIENHLYFVGSAKGEELSLYYSAADIFVISSYYDNFPNVVLEAMSMELPVVATRVGGIPSQIEEDTTGFLINPKDDFEMSQCILKLLSDPEKISTMSKAAALAVRNKYDWQRTAKLFLKHAQNIKNDKKL